MRDRLKNLGILGLPSAAPDLRPVLHARRCDPTQGTGFFLQVDLTNHGDAAADNLRLTISHTRETQHRANSPFQPWVHENQELNPWTISLTRAMNPDERLPVLQIPFGIQAPLNGRVEVHISSRTTQARIWYAQAKEADITGNARIEFVPDTPPWPKEYPKPVSNEPQFAPAKRLLDEILSNTDAETKGLTVILAMPTGQFGTQFYFPSTASGTSDDFPTRVMDDVDFAQALRELLSLGCLRLLGDDGYSAVYRLTR